MIVPKEQLEDIGFKETKKGLFVKQVSHSLKYFRDYRGDVPVGYAYQNDKHVDCRLLNDHAVVRRVEMAVERFNNAKGLKKFM